MREAVLDTNVIIYALAGQPADLAAGARRLLAAAGDGRVQLWVTAAVIAAAVYVLSGPQFRSTRKDVADRLTALVRLPGMVGDDIAAIGYGLRRFADGVDFVDGHLAGRALERGMAVATFNVRHFAPDVPVFDLSK